MIKLKNYTPSVYYNESRDFQFIGRLFDIVLNSLKTEADLLYNMPIGDNSNDELLELFALTLGFKSNKKYNSKQLRAICKVFPEIIKNKGSIKAIQIACNALFSANGSTQILDYEFSNPSSKTDLNLYIPQDFNDVSLLTNLLSYLLPAGMSCNIVKELKQNLSSTTELTVADILSVYKNNLIDSTNTEIKDYFYNNNLLAIMPRLEDITDKSQGTLSTGEAIRAAIKDNQGFLANSGVFRPDTMISDEISGILGYTNKLSQEDLLTLQEQYNQTVNKTNTLKDIEEEQNNG